MSFPLVGNLSSLFFRKGSEGVVIKKNSGQAPLEAQLHTGQAGMTFKEINITLIGGRHAEEYCRKDF